MSTGNTVILFLAREPGIEGIPKAEATRKCVRLCVCAFCAVQPTLLLLLLLHVCVVVACPSPLLSDDARCVALVWLPLRIITFRATAAVQARIDNGLDLTGDAFVGRLKFIVPVPASFDFSKAAFELRFTGSSASHSAQGGGGGDGVAVTAAIAALVGAAVIATAFKVCSSPTSATTQGGRSTRSGSADEASAGVSYVSLFFSVRSLSEECCCAWHKASAMKLLRWLVGWCILCWQSPETERF